MVVAENSCSHSKSPGSTRGSRGAGSHHLTTIAGLRFAMMIAIGLITPVTAPAWAAGIVADAQAPSAQQPMIVNSAKGTPQINIRAPSAAGVSRNTYSQFDVDGRGVILNNAQRNVQTQLGGWIEGNPLLGHNSARVILNEVNSSNPSQLAGYMEVAGQRAQVVIANPAGITCDGCGFINADRATLSTARVQMENGAISGFQVQDGTLKIEGKGLDARQTDYTDLIARAVRVNAGIWANDLKVTTGRNRVSADNSQAEAVAGDAQTRPQLAIDVAQLGGMYAGKIMLVGTETGVGVRNAGHIGAMAGDVVISADGKLQNAGTVTSATSLQLKTAADIDNSGTLYARGNLALESAQQTLNSNTIAAQGNVAINAASLLGKAESVLAAGLNADSSLADNGALQLNANTIVLDGALTQGLGISIQAQSLSNRQGRILQLGNNPLQINVTGLVDNRLGVINSAGDTRLTLGSLDNREGTVLSTQHGNLTITAQASIENGKGVLAAGDRVSLTGQSLNNQAGQLQAQGNISLALEQRLDNRRGLIRAGELLDVVTGQLDNSRTADSDQGIEGKSIQLMADSLNNQNGAIRAESSIDIGTRQTLDNQRGLISASGQLHIRKHAPAQTTGSILNNEGTLIGGKLLALDTAYFSGNGRVLSLGDLTFHSTHALTIDGQFQANKNLNLQLDNALTVNGTLSAGTSLQVQAQSLDNRASGDISAATINMALSGGWINRGVVDGQQVRLQADTLTNLGTGRLYGDQLAIATTALINREEDGHAAVIAARETLNIGTDTLLNREQALIFSAGDLAIGNTLSASGQAEGRAQWLHNASATIEALGDLSMRVQRIHNSNEHFSTRVVEVSRDTVQEFQLSGAANRYTPGQISITNDEVDYLHTPEGVDDSWNRYDYTRVVQETQVAESAPARILSGGNMHLYASELLNDKSQIIAGGRLQASVDTLNNTTVSGERVTTDWGSVTHFYRDKKKGRDKQGSNTASYVPAPIIQSISLSPTVYQQHARVEGSGTQLNGHDRQPLIQQTAAVGANLIRTAEAPISLPANSLFHTNPDTSSHYLVVTDPRFASYRNWMSSDYMLQQLRVDPAQTQQRLGDGFYEQKLIREQILQLTGRRFLNNYASDEEQYRALMDSAVTVASQWQLVPGIALTAAQVAALTSDIIWLVAKPVTLANGEVKTVLVPQVYVRVKAGDIDGSGALIAGQQLNLDVSGDVINSGSLVGRSVMALTAENIHNLGGRIQADTATVQARSHLNNLGGLMGAVDALTVKAGKDLTLTSTTQDSASSQGSRTSLSRVAGLFVSGTNGTMQVSAGNDLNLNAAQVVNAGTGATVLSAGRDINFGTVAEANQQSIVWGKNNGRHEGSRTEVGSTVQAQGDLHLNAGQDLNARGATLTSDKGAVLVGVQRDINLTEGENSQFVDEAHRYKGKSGLLSSKTISTRDTLSETLAQGTTLSGEQAYLQAGRDLNLRGSNVVSSKQTVLLADRDINIQAATDHSSERHAKTEKKSGLFSGGGIALTVGSQAQSVSNSATQHRAVASTVGSTHGDVLIAAGKAYQQTGSHILAPQGDIDISAERISVEEARTLSEQVRETRFKQTGVSVTITNPVISAIQTAQHMKKAADKTDDSRMQALALATTALAANNAATAVAQNPAQAGGINISISLGTQKNESTTQQRSDTAAGSTLLAGNDITLNANGAGSASNITVRGSQLKAGNNASLRADGDIHLLAASNSNQQQSDSRGSSASVGIGFALGTRNGFTLNLGVSGNRGESDGQDITHTNTRIEAGNTLALQSGGDTTLKGAVATGKQVVADIGRDLRIESLQDTSTYKVDEKSMGVGVSLCIPPFCYGASSVSGNFGKTDINSSYASVTEQSGIRAGDNGFQIRVGNNTDLAGAIIASSDNAIKDGRNTLSTATLTHRDIENQASYHGSSLSVGGGYGADIGKDQQGHAQAGSTQTPGTTLPSEGGVSSTLPIAIAAKDSADSLTRSGISGGLIDIRDDTAQQSLTGKSAEETLSSLNRDVSSDRDTSNTLKPIFDEEKIRAGFEIVSSLNREVGTFLDNKAKESTAAKETLDKERSKPQDQQNPAVIQQLTDTLKDNQTWEFGGTSRAILTALTAAAGGNISGSGASMLQASAVNYLQGLATQQVKVIADNLDSEVARTALHGLLACAGAAAQSASCGSAALGAASSVVLNNLVEQLTGQAGGSLTPAEKEARKNIVSSIITGITATAGGEAAIANTAAQIEAENNAFWIPVILGAAWLIDKGITAYDAYQDIQALRDGTKTLDQLLSEKGEEYIAQVIAGNVGKYGMKAVKVGGKWIAGKTDDIVRIEQDGAKATGQTLREVEVSSGGKGAWNKELNKPEPNTIYKVDGNKTYQTDSLGRVERVESNLALTKNDRNTYRQCVAGKCGIDGDEGGHLIASILNGPGELLNLLPMNGNLNKGAWKTMENQWASALKEGKSVGVKIEPVYTGGSVRPEKFTVTYQIGSDRPVRETFVNSPGGI
ncbi:hemagglutinin repeat-containing protein [Lelliottia amnigena]|uniref:hemagglutinin repeat-containing protein n=1 Tax=Lelliottia amnigena TaxID=61646 RepID=UPI004056F7B3